MTATTSAERRTARLAGIGAEPMIRGNRLVQRLYRRYLCGPSHPSKLRVVRWIERRLFPSEGLPFDVGGGIRLYLHPRSDVEARLLRRQEYQASLNRFLEQNMG